MKKYRPPRHNGRTNFMTHTVNHCTNSNLNYIDCKEKVEFNKAHLSSAPVLDTIFCFHRGLELTGTSIVSANGYLFVVDFLFQPFSSLSRPDIYKPIYSSLAQMAVCP